MDDARRGDDEEPDPFPARAHGLDRIPDLPDLLDSARACIRAGDKNDANKITWPPPGP